MKNSLEQLCYDYSQASWRSHYLIPSKQELYPSETIVRLLSPYFDKNLTLIDIGGGTGKNGASLSSRFKKTLIVDPAISSRNDCTSQKQTALEMAPQLISNEADLTQIISDDAVILCTYTLDHMPKSMGLHILKSLVSQRESYKGLVISSFLDSSVDAMNIPIFGCPDHYLRPFSIKYFNQINQILCDGQISIHNIHKISSSGALAELHTFYNIRELFDVLSCLSPVFKSHARIIKINEQQGSIDFLNKLASPMSLDILFISL